VKHFAVQENMLLVGKGKKKREREKGSLSSRGGKKFSPKGSFKHRRGEGRDINEEREGVDKKKLRANRVQEVRSR